MAPSPITGLRFIHLGILAEAQAIENLAQADPPDFAQIADRVTMLDRVALVHTDGEAEVMFPQLGKKVEHVSAGYLLDHEEERETFAELGELLTRATAGRADAATVGRIRRQTIALSAHLASHIHKEDQLITPLIGANFTPEEQGQMIAQMVGKIPPADLPIALPWLFSRLSIDDRLAYANEVMRNMPPPVQAAARGWIRGGLPADEWAELTRRLPEWASA